MRVTFRSIHRFRDMLTQIGTAVSASAEYTRSSVSRADFGAADSESPQTAVSGFHLPF